MTMYYIVKIDTNDEVEVSAFMFTSVFVVMCLLLYLVAVRVTWKSYGLNVYLMIVFFLLHAVTIRLSQCITVPHCKIKLSMMLILFLSIACSMYLFSSLEILMILIVILLLLMLALAYY